MDKNIHPFIPISIRHEWPGEKIVAGALLFADISGFTAMSERLGAVGKPGTEELTRILNECFDTMLCVIEKYKGDVIRFAGDALLVRYYDAERASAYARRMMREVKKFKKVKTLYGDFVLSMKTVIATGQWNEFVLGTGRRAELFLSGTTVKVLAEAEDRAKAGDIIEVKGEQSSLRLMNAKPLPHQIRLESFLPEGVMQVIPKGMFGEHRPVACVFVTIDGYDENNPDIDSLRELFDAIIDISNQYDGSIQLIDNIAPHGSKTMLLFGAPLSYGDNVKRAVLAGMDICRILSTSSPLKIKVGINQGFAYAGIVGNNWRKVYTVIGDVVNTAARLVTTAAYGQVVVSQDVYRLTNRIFEFDDLKPVRVKGKKKHLKRYTPTQSQEQIIHRFGFVGRETEISNIMEAVMSGRKVITITGEAGIGKSRLLDEMSWRLRERECTVLRGSTDELKPTFYVFASMVKEEAGIKDSDTPYVKKRKLEALVKSLMAYARKPDDVDSLNRRLPFIGTMLFELDYPGSIYERVSPKLRIENLYDALRYFIEFHAEPICIMLDDIHWAKEEEIEALTLLTHMLLVHGKKNITFIIAKRPKQKAIQLDTSLTSISVRLGELDRSSVDQLMLQILDHKPLEGALDAVFRAKVDGNPFFLEQFLLYLIEKGLIQQRGNEWVRSERFEGEALPEDIFAMILSRVDRLGELTKESLRTASIIGTEFKENIISSIIGQPVDACLAKTVKERLTHVTNIAEREYAFSQVIIKDVIYDSILRKRRKVMHAAVAEAIEAMYKKRLRDYFGILAHHCDCAESWEKSLRYHIQAGEVEKVRYANDTAVSHFKKAVSLVEKRLKCNMSDLISVYEHLGDISNIKGEYENAIKSYAAMAHYAQKDTLARVTSRRKTADILARQGLYDGALRILNSSAKKLVKRSEEQLVERAEISLLQCSIYRKKGDFEKAAHAGRRVLTSVRQLRGRERNVAKEFLRSISRLEAEGYVQLGRLYYHRGMYSKAIEYFENALTILEQIKDVREIGIACGNLGTAFKGKGDYLRAIKLLGKSLKIAAQIGEKRETAIVSVNLGNIYYAYGDYDKAIESYENSLVISEEIGDKEGIGVVCNNLGLLYKVKGEYGKALSLFRRNLTLRKKMGDKRGISIALDNIGSVLEEQGKLNKAETTYLRSLKLAEEIGDKVGVAAAYGSLGMICKIRMDYTRATQLLQKDLKIRRQIGDKAGMGEALRILGDIYICKNACKKAEDVLRQAVHVLHDVKARKELVQSYLSLGEGTYKLGKKRRANRHFLTAIRLARKTGAQAQIATCHYVYGKVCTAMAEFDTARKNLREAMKIFTKLKQQKLLADVYHAYAQLLTRVAQTKAAKRMAALYRRKAQKIYKKLSLPRLPDV